MSFTLEATTESQLVGRIEQADAILAWHDLQWTAPVLDTLTRCKVLVRVGVGFDNVDLAAAKQRNIVVCNVPDYGTHDVRRPRDGDALGVGARPVRS